MTGFRARWWVALALTTVTAVTLSACGSSNETTTGGAGFPAKVAAGNGTVSIPHEPHRIVSLSASATEDLYAVGAGSQVVAVDSYSTYPSQAPRTNLSGFTPNVEAIAKYKPDLVVIDQDTQHIVAQLGKLGIPVLVEPPAATLNQAYDEITDLGRATGHSDRSGPVVDGMKRQIAQIANSVPRPTSPLRVYHELDQTYYSATSRTFIGELYTLLGLTNIADKAKGASDYPQLSAEYIISSDPSLIVLADTVCCKQNAATVAARPGWGNIAAVKNGDVLPVDDSVASEWGPRIVLFMRKIADAVQRVEGQSSAH